MDAIPGQFTTVPYNSNSAIRDYTAIATMPVTIGIVKKFLAIDSDYEDDLIETIYMPAAIQACEVYTNIGLVPLATTVTLINQCGNVRLPYAPIQGAIVYKDANGNTVDAPDLATPTNQIYTATYTGGYAEGKMPPDLITAFLQYIAFISSNKGNVPTDKDLPTAFKTLRKYRTVL